MVYNWYTYYTLYYLGRHTDTYRQSHTALLFTTVLKDVFHIKLFMKSQG